MQIEITEVSPALTEGKALKLAQKCGKCKEECAEGCSVRVKIPEFVRAIKAGQFEKAADIMYSDNPFPSLTGRLCSAPCEVKCPRNVPIRSLERFIGDNFLPQIKKKSKSKKTVAVVGTGISGLACANHFIEQGLQVTMIEVRQEPGGFLYFGIPEFRIPRAVLQAELGRVIPHVKVNYDKVAGTYYTIEELGNKFDAVVLATGASKPVFGIDGDYLPHVFTPTEYSHSSPGGLLNALIIGGTNGALESALVARSRGSQALIVYEKDIESMDVDRDLLKAALKNGVQFLLLTKPLRLHGESSVSSLECLQMRLSDPFEGHREPVPIDDSEFHAECDHIIIAKGYEAHPSIAIHSNLRQAGKHKIWTNPIGQTTIENVFAAGGLVLGDRHFEDVVAHSKLIATNVVAFLKQKK